jgi:taurine dioxygenase
MEIVPSGAPVGAEITGVNLAGEVDESTFGQIREALNQHSMIFFRGQKSFSEKKQIEFSLRFGPLQERVSSPQRLTDYPDILVISNIIENGRPIGLVEAGQYWHSDLPFSDKPPLYTCLHALEIPVDQEGRTLGGTMFAGTNFAYETLSDDLKARIAGKRAFHTMGVRKVSSARKAAPTEFDNIPGHDHVVVRTHPVTGKKCLYVNETYTARILDMSEDESSELLRILCQHVTRPEYIYTHRWEPDDVVMWDDCALQHHAINDYKLPQRRLLYRATIDGTPPF